MSAASDVLVIGAGIIGCAVAFELAHRGARVQVLDARDVGRGATQASAGVLAPYIEAHQSGPLMELGVRSLALFDDFVSGACEASGLPVRYARCGTLQLAADAAEQAYLDEVAGACADREVSVERLSGGDLRERVPQLAPDLAGLFISAHRIVAAAELTRALAQAAARRGVAFTPDCAVRAIARGANGVRVETASATLQADRVVLAAGSWSSGLSIGAIVPPAVKPIRGQLLHLDAPGVEFEPVLWGSQCYLVPWPDGSLLVGATVEDVGFDERVTVSGVRDLLEAACDLVPPLWQAGIRSLKVGLRPASPDGLPIVGPSMDVPGLFYATAHYRNGILLAPLTARVTADYITEGREDPMLARTSPRRFGRC